MRVFIRIIIVFFLCSILVVIVVAIGLRESLGGQYRFDYTSPSHSDYRVEIYEHAGMVGNPSFSLFAIDSGARQYLGDLGTDVNSSFIGDLFWSRDGSAIFYGETNHRSAYVFGKGTAQSDIEKAQEPDAILQKHGGRETSFFDYKFDPTSFIWRDFLPAENN